MDIVELMKQGNINVTISLNELKEVLKEMFNDFKGELKTELKIASPANDEKYLTLKEASEMLKVDKTTLWRWEKINYLLPVRVGNHPKYKKSDIDNLYNR
jgi:hypothetical protein